MGEAKRRAEAFDAGTSWPRRRVCPVKRCRSVRVRDLPANDPACRDYAKFWRNANVTPLRVCLDCEALWEPWPDHASTDCVERARTDGPCDNCAFRAGSAEMADPKEREKLLAMARSLPHVDFGDAAAIAAAGHFCCHKGVPIVLDEREGLRFDYEAAGISPTQQACTGFLLAVWAEGKRMERGGR